MTGVNIVHVPYKGSGAALVALMSNEVQVSFATSASLAPLAKSGKLRTIAVSTIKPSLLAPDLPTVATTIPGYDSGGLTGMFAPRRTPPAIVNRLNREVVAFLNQASTKETSLNAGVEIVGNTPEEAVAKLKDETVKWSKVIKKGGVKQE